LAWSIVTEGADEQLGTFEQEWQHELRGGAEELEAGGKHADDLARTPVHHHRPADHVGIAAELPLPVGIRQHRPFRRFGRVVIRGEAAAEVRVHAQQAERPVGDEQRIDAFGLSAAGHRYGRVVPEPDVLERASFLAIHQIGRRRLIHDRESHPRGRVPHADQRVRVGKRQRLQEHAANHAENRGVRADAERERNHGDEGERRRGGEAPHDAAEPSWEDLHGSLDGAVARIVRLRRRCRAEALAWRRA
jgi:hypothetical protein